MLKLHHLEQSRSTRIIWALEELGLDYALQHYRRLPSFAAPATLQQIHPLGTAPILENGDLCLPESAAILEYLQSEYDTNQQFRPQSKTLLIQYVFWMHFAEASLMPLLVMHLVMTKVSTQVPFLIRPIAKQVGAGVKKHFIQPRLGRQLDYIEQHLAQHAYFAGEFSFADIQMSFPLHRVQQRLQGAYPNIQAYLKRIEQRPAYQRAIAKE